MWQKHLIAAVVGCVFSSSNEHSWRLSVSSFLCFAEGSRGFCHLGDSFAPVVLWATGRNLTDWALFFVLGPVLSVGSQNFWKGVDIPVGEAHCAGVPPFPTRDLSLLLMSIGNTLREEGFLYLTDFSTIKQVGKTNKVFVFVFLFPNKTIIWVLSCIDLGFWEKLQYFWNVKEKFCMSAHIWIKTCILFLTAFNVKKPLVFSGEHLKLLCASIDILSLVSPIPCWFLGHWCFPEAVGLGDTWPNNWNFIKLIIDRHAFWNSAFLAHFVALGAIFCQQM